MIKVKSTTDYSRFKFIRGNRPIDKRVKKMVRAIKRKNMLADFPILTRPNGDGRNEIFDGQTRFEAAKQLRLPVFYIENDKIKVEDISETNSVQSPWTTRDYVHSWSERGNKHFQLLKAFVAEFGLPITTAGNLLIGKMKESGGNVAKKVRDGDFRVIDEDGARKVATFIVALKSRIPFATDRPLAIALSRVMSVPTFDPQRFLQKLAHANFVKLNNVDQYVTQIEEIYNHRVRSNQLVPLAIEVRKLHKPAK